jgi:polyhydroxybutyrate depolymerase
LPPFLVSSVTGRPTATETLRKVFGQSQSRNVTIQVPSSFNTSPSTPRPLIMVLHPLSGSAGAILTHLGLSTLKDDYTNGAFVIVPQGDNIANGPTSAWNASTSCCENDGPPPSFPHADAVYLHQLLTDSIAEINKVGAVDTTRVYVIGESNGGFMAYRLACLYSADVTGIVVFAGAGDTASDAATYGACDTSHRVAVMHVHGAGDSTVTYAGGAPVPGLSPALDNVKGAEASAEVYATLNGCTTPGSLPSSTGTLDFETNDAGSETEKRPWTGCASGGQVTFYKAVGAGHSTNWTFTSTPHDEIINFISANHR